MEAKCDGQTIGLATVMEAKCDGQQTTDNRQTDGLLYIDPLSIGFFA